MDEFYVGYLPKAPPGIRRRVRLLVGGVVIASVAGAILFAAAQKNFANSTFEFGRTREFQGILVQDPYPSLMMRPTSDAEESEKTYLLVAQGKHGAEQIVRGFAGKNVCLKGTLIQRDEGRMIEVNPGSIAATAAVDRSAQGPRVLGEFTLKGEIVDSKCFLGVMNPGEGKVHRDCAVRCISGGIPPALLTSDFNGSQKILLLTDENGKPLRKSILLDLVAQPVQIHGLVLEKGNILYLEATATQITALH